MAGIQDILGGTLLESVKGLIDSFHLSPEKAAEFKQAADANAAALAQKQLDLDAKTQDTLAREVEAASQNIRAEASSGDKYTSRARPSFIYVMLLLLVFNYGVIPFTHGKPLDWPDPLFWLFGSAMLGYTGARTWEKVAKINGGSQ